MRKLPAGLMLLAAGCSGSDELVVRSVEGHLTLAYSCSSISPTALTEPEFDLVEELAMTAYRHAMANGKSSDAANLPLLRESRSLDALELAVVEYICQNRDALKVPRVSIVRYPISTDSIAPNFALPQLRKNDGGRIVEGDSLSFASLRGKTVVVHILATWCPPCRTEHQDLIDLLPQIGSDVVILGVITHDHPVRAIPWLEENGGLPFPIVVDRHRRMANRYGIRSFPQLYLIDRSGKVVYHQKGSGTEALTEELARLADRDPA